MNDDMNFTTCSLEEHRTGIALQGMITGKMNTLRSQLLDQGLVS